MDGRMAACGSEAAAMGAALSVLLAFWTLCRVATALPRANAPDFQDKENDDDMTDSHDACTGLKWAEQISDIRVMRPSYGARGT